jgi:hypothetical protein
MKTYMLPSGESTKKVREYIKAWEDIYKPICNATGARLICFDPSLQFSYKGYSFTLPVSFAEKIRNEILK